MTAESNKQIMSDAMQSLATGDTRPFGALMHPDFTWTITGSTSWSGEYRRLQAVRTELLAPLFANFTTRYVNRPVRILADGDFVVVECRGHAMTKSGTAYDQAYCYVIEMRDGQMIGLTEYLDTALVERALEPRPQ